MDEPKTTPEIESLTADNMDKVFSAPPGSFEKEPAQESQEENRDNEKGKEEIPEKFKGKTQEEILKSYKNLEKYSGRLANEIASIKSTLAEKLGVDKKEVTPESISEIIEKMAKEKKETIENAETKEEEKDAINDYETFIDDPDGYIKKKFSEMSPELLEEIKQGMIKQYEQMQAKEKIRVNADKLAMSFVQDKAAEGYEVNPADLAKIIQENPNIVPKGEDPVESMKKGLDIAFNIYLSQKYKERGIASQTIASKKEEIKTKKRDKLLGID